jgi:hypothetical protein
MLGNIQTRIYAGLEHRAKHLDPQLDPRERIGIKKLNMHQEQKCGLIGSPSVDLR